MKIKLFLISYCYIFLCVLGINNAVCQDSNIKRSWHWYFGSGAGIDFSDGAAKADTNGLLFTSEGCSSISDTSGNLLFYTDGRTVWNKSNQVMPNGIGLLGGVSGSSTQAALIIPIPHSENLFYIITTDEAPGTNGMRYSLVDMNFENGLGDVTNKNNLLFKPSCEKLAGVNHCNGSDVWILGHEIDNNNFRAYLITQNGIDTNAIISPTGFISNSSNSPSLFGCLKFSPNGKKVCSATDSLLNTIQLFDFDNSSGVVSRPITLTQSEPYSFAICFSPDNSKLYTGSSSLGKLFQYVISINDSNSILNSKTLIYSSIHGEANDPRYAQNAPDGKIYINRLNVDDSILYSIDEPNNQGTACNINFMGINLNGKVAQSGLPNFNESYFNESVIYDCSNYLSEIDLLNVEASFDIKNSIINIKGKGVKQVNVFDITSKLILHLNAQPFIDLNIISTENLLNGLYILLIQVNNKWISQKISLIK